MAKHITLCATFFVEQYLSFDWNHPNPVGSLYRCHNNDISIIFHGDLNVVCLVDILDISCQNASYVV